MSDRDTTPDPALLEEVRKASRAYAAAVKKLEATQQARDAAWHDAWNAGWSFGRIGEASSTPSRTVQWTIRAKPKVRGKASDQ
jgi:hypothetical protein